jgi:hypothetical protein
LTVRTHCTRNLAYLLNAPKPMTWLGNRLQWNRLRQSYERLNAKQVGQHHRFLCQELVKGQHSVCSRQLPFLSPTSLCGGSWALWLAPRPSSNPTPTEPIAARFFKEEKGDASRMALSSGAGKSKYVTYPYLRVKGLVGRWCRGPRGPQAPQSLGFFQARGRHSNGTTLPFASLNGHKWRCKSCALQHF